MDTAAKILIVGGILNLAYGYVSGVFFAAERAHRKYASRYLVMAHVGPFMQGPMLLALVFATRLSSMSAAAETLAAVLLVAGSILIAAKDTVNWLQGVEDEFAERPILPRLLGGVGVVASTVGFALVLTGVLRAL